MSETAPRPHRFERLRLAIIEHNWFHVAVEVLIVTVGVLLAFEVEQWGDRRERAAEERQFLERLYAEYGRSLGEIGRVNQWHEKVLHDIGAVFRARGNDALLRRYAETNDFGCGGPRFPSATFNDTGFQEIVSSGRLNLISDPQLRSDVRDLAAQQAAASVQIGYGRELVLTQLPATNAYYRFDIGREGEVRCSLDWPSALNDPLAVTALVRAYRAHGTSRNERLKVAFQTRQILNVLACKLGKPECREITSPPS